MVRAAPLNPPHPGGMPVSGIHSGVGLPGQLGPRKGIGQFRRDSAGFTGNIIEMIHVRLGCGLRVAGEHPYHEDGLQHGP